MGFEHLKGAFVGLLVRETKAVDLVHPAQAAEIAVLHNLDPAAEPPFHLGLQFCQITCHIVTLSPSFIPACPRQMRRGPCEPRSLSRSSSCHALPLLSIRSTFAAFQSSPTVAISSAHHTPNLHKCSACYSSTTSHTQHSTSGEGNFTDEKSGGNLSTPNFTGATPSATRKRCAPCVNGTTRTRTDAASGH